MGFTFRPSKQIAILSFLTLTITNTGFRFRIGSRRIGITISNKRMWFSCSIKGTGIAYKKIITFKQKGTTQ